MKKKVTMSDIAVTLGISRSTVSRAINFEPVVADEIALEIRRKAKEMGYRFKKNRKSQINPAGVKKVIIISNLPFNYYSTLILSLTEALSKQNFVPEFYQETEVLPELLKEFSGVILLHTPGKEIMKHLKNHACVQILGTPNPSEQLIDIITYDNTMTGVLAAEWLYSKGCKNLVAVTPRGLIGETRSHSFSTHAEKLGCKTKVVYISNPATHNFEEAFDKIHSETPEIDGLFTFNDYVMISLFPQVINAGYKIGKNIQLIGCDAQLFSNMLNPQPATIDLHMLQIGRRAAEALDWRIKNPKDQAVTLMLQPEIIDSNSYFLKDLINSNAMAV